VKSSLTSLLLALAILALGFGAGYFTASKPNGPDPAYWIERSAYNRDLALANSQTQASLAIIAERDQKNAELLSCLATAKQKISDLKAASASQSLTGRELSEQNARLKADAQAAIDANPALRALIDNFDLRCANYESQLSLLAQQISELEHGLSAAQELGLSIQTQRDEWKANYEREHALRLTSDALRLGLEKKTRSNNLWSKVGKASAFGLAIWGGAKIAKGRKAK
jgi:chromosome segregation ATPase